MKPLNCKGAILAGLAITASIVVCGCTVLAPREDRSRYFILVPVAGSNAAGNGAAIHARPIIVGFGPISIPRYLDRPEIITRTSNTEFSISDTDRWGESLDSNVSRVLAQDVSSDLGNLEIVPFPWSRQTHLDYKCSVEFQRLERSSDGTADVQAFWTIRTGSDDKIVQSGTTTTSRAVDLDQRSAMEALSEGVSQVSRDIAQALGRQSKLEIDRAVQTRS